MTPEDSAYQEFCQMEKRAALDPATRNAILKRMAQIRRVYRGGEDTFDFLKNLGQNYYSVTPPGGQDVSGVSPGTGFYA